MSANGLALNTLIKNTFISVPVPNDEGSPSRRSTSLPPGLRLSQGTEEAENPQKLCDPFRIERTASWAEASTDASDADDDCSPPNSVYGVDTDTETDFTCETPSASFAAVCSTPLSGKAAPWQPSAFRIVHDPLPYTFGQESARMVTTMKKAVEDSELARGVEVLNHGTSGWYISIQVFDMADTEKLLTIAKKALLEAADESSCCYVLGYLRDPFVFQANGFTSVLGAMRDERNACWDTYSRGVCRKPGCCRFAHPPCRVPLEVALWS